MQLRRRSTPVAAIFAIAFTGCGGGSTSSLGTAPQAALSSTVLAAAIDAKTYYVCPSGMTSSGPLDCTKLPLGDKSWSTSAPAVGTTYSCVALSGQPVVQNAPWINNAKKLWNLTAKLKVEGSVAWSGSFKETVSGKTRTVSANAVPVSPYKTGTFPISPNDPAYKYDHNPNSIAKHSLSFTFATTPTVASSPSCLSPGLVGITVSGYAIYDMYDGAGYDGAARELQDGCLGHPDMSNTYHVHGELSFCTPDNGSASRNSPLLGYALDGFGIYGPWYDGKILTTKDLDQCHGTTSVVAWDGKKVAIYHYVSTYDYPYNLSCYAGKPIHSGPPA
jgi:hypothetical protein